MLNSMGNSGKREGMVPTLPKNQLSKVLQLYSRSEGVIFGRFFFFVLNVSTSTFCFFLDFFFFLLF